MQRYTCYYCYAHKLLISLFLSLSLWTRLKWKQWVNDPLILWAVTSGRNLSFEKCLYLAGDRFLCCSQTTVVTWYPQSHVSLETSQYVLKCGSMAFLNLTPGTSIYPFLSRHCVCSFYLNHKHNARWAINLTNSQIQHNIYPTGIYY